MAHQIVRFISNGNLQPTYMKMKIRTFQHSSELQIAELTIDQCNPISSLKQLCPKMIDEITDYPFQRFHL